MGQIAVFRECMIWVAQIPGMEANANDVAIFVYASPSFQIILLPILFSVRLCVCACLHAHACDHCYLPPQQCPAFAKYNAHFCVLDQILVNLLLHSTLGRTCKGLHVFSQRESNLVQVTHTIRWVHGNVSLWNGVNESCWAVPARLPNSTLPAMNHQHPLPCHTYPAYLQLIHCLWQRTRGQSRLLLSAETGFNWDVKLSLDRSC